jgi:hypothetical protein
VEPGLAAPTIVIEAPKYPEVVNPEVVPSWTMTSLVPLVETPLNTTVTRLTQLGMLVKSMLVPEVDA